jgi:hypothetical protein
VFLDAGPPGTVRFKEEGMIILAVRMIEKRE